MQYSPKLKRAMEQIKKIMKDNDIAGFAVLHTPGHAEFAMEITPSYSCAKLTPRHDGIEIKGKLIHYNGDAKKRDQKLADTCNMLNLLSVIMMQQGLNLGEVSKNADALWNAEHDEGNMTSTEQQNN